MPELHADLEKKLKLNQQDEVDAAIMRTLLERPGLAEHYAAGLGRNRDMGREQGVSPGEDWAIRQAMSGPTLASAFKESAEAAGVTRPAQGSIAQNAHPVIQPFRRSGVLDVGEYNFPISPEYAAAIRR